jgi:ABC-2 type transport system permease protein
MNQVSNFQPTFAQRLLGRHYKWWYILTFYFKVGTAYRGSTLFWMVGRLLALGLTMLIWYLNIQSGSNLIDFKTVFTYYIIGTLFAWESGLNWNVAGSITSGAISTRLLSPLSFFKVAFLRDFGWWLYSNLFQTFVLGILLILGRDYLIFSNLLNILFYLILSFLSYFIISFMGIAIGSMAFYFVEVQGLLNIQNELRFYLSGKAIPLNVSPILAPISYLPFALTFYFPMQIYLGKYDTLGSFKICLLAFGWCIILYLLAKVTFKKGLKHHEAVGL